MKRISAITLCVCLLSVAAPGCRRRDKKIRVQQTDEDTATLASVIQMGDPKAAPQLLNGFFNIESNTWRWTMGKFTVALRPPRNAGVKGATLHLKFVLPEAVLSKIKTTSISAKVGSRRSANWTTSIAMRRTSCHTSTTSSMPSARTSATC